MSNSGRSALSLLVAAGLAAAIHAPAGAQLMENRLTLHGVTLSLSGIEQARLQDLSSLLRSTNRAAQDRAVGAAEAVADSDDAHYLLAVYKLELGRQRRDDALSAPSLDVLIASRMTPAERLPGYLGLRGDIAFRQRDYATAALAWGRLAELQPNDPQSLVNMAQVRNAQDDAVGALDLIQRAISARRSGPGPVPESWYRQWVSIAYNSGQAAQGVAAAQALVSAYPTPENWRFALVAYRQLAAPSAGAEIDLLRLMRAAGAFARPNEYQRLAQLLMHAGLATEARAVLDDGLSRRILERAQPPTPAIIGEVDRAVSRQPGRIEALRRQTAGAASGLPASAMADALLGEARFLEAAALYRTALARGGVDSAAVNTRLGVALMLAGRRGEAETAFRAVAGESAAAPAQLFYPSLAGFWLSWLAQSG